MHEALWLKCQKPKVMLRHLRDRASDRKLRLFACACCRCLWDLLVRKPSRRVVEVAEQFADGLATRPDLRAAGKAAQPDFRRYNSERTQIIQAADAARACAYADGWTAAHVATSYAQYTGPPASQQADLLRDICGNPFRPIEVPPAWLTADVKGLTRAIYDERAFDRLPILGDALEEAGCDNAAILEHCRGPGPHVRGCWAIDLLAGKR
jgi:hypothetical protein